MPVDRQARTTLRNALIGYMSGAIRTFAFEAEYGACRKSSDEGVQGIVQQLWYTHDDLMDHPISVTSQGWEALRRTVALLGTDRAISPRLDAPSWPFNDEAEWHLHEHLVDELGLPDYDPEVHGRPANRWWNRIPSSVGFLVLGALLAAVFITIALS